MKHSIKVLSEQTANQIAAGEVIVRPASVLKELVENSIDASSKRIEIRLREGGLKGIRVIDDGRGMSESDCRAAFVRHATSKINSIEDLLKIKTLGFRGEALPSIASVSKTKLISRRADSGEGTKVLLHGGKLVESIAVGCPVGTDILVEDLFFNVPARKKYINKPATEAFQSAELVQKLALAYPCISFKFWHNEHLVFTTNGLGNLADVLIVVYGLEYVEKTIPISYQDNNIQVEGVIGKSYFHRSNRERQVFIVNGRVVKNNLIQNTLENAYRGKLPVKRYPIAIISINVPPASVDINVHPTKSEVKFIFNEQMIQGLTQALAGGLYSKPHIPFLFESEQHKYIHPELKQKNISAPMNDFFQTSLTSKMSSRENSLVEYGPENIENRLHGGEHSSEIEQVKNDFNNEIFPVMKVVGQLFDSFIVAEGQDAFYIIDQHGAHERIYYEDLLEKYSKRAVRSQGLAIPTILKLTAIESQLLIEKIITLADLGIIIEHFGNNDFLVRTAPEGLDSNEVIELVKELLQKVSKEGLLSYDLLNEKILKLIACKQAIKANLVLSLAEQQMLIEKLSTKKDPFTCPHGRPIITSMSTKDLRKRFDRE
ncbi:MAG: DNA mismatch repair endonuclease MutL [Bacillota bacterium]